jgi:hypothetical protein
VRFRLIPASLALWLAIGSLALSIFGVVPALAAIFVALWGLRGRPSITGRRTVGTVVLALCVAVGVLVFWSAVFGVLFLNLRTEGAP